MTNNQLAFRALTLLMLTPLAACAPSRAESEGQEPSPVRERAAVPVTLAPITLLPVDRELVVLGRVTHARDLKLGFKTGGVVAELLVEEGERVTRGQVLARLDPSELEAGLAQAQAGLAKASRDLARVRGLESQAVLPGSTREDAETARAVAAAQVRGLRWNLETTTLTADTDGVVLKRLAEPGEVVGPGQPVLVIGDESAGVRVEIGLSARDLARAALGGSVTVQLDGAANALPSKVVEIAPTLTPGTDRVSVFASLPTELRPPRGLVATVRLPPRQLPVLPAIPLSTVVEGQGATASVWVMVGTAGAPVDCRPDTAPCPATASPPGAIRRQAITIHSVRPDGMVLVEAGLEDVTHVIDAGQAWLDAEATVVVEEAP